MPKQGDETIRKSGPGAGLLKNQFTELSTAHTVWRSVGDALYQRDKKSSTPEESKNHTRAKNPNLVAEARISRFLERLERVIAREAIGPLSRTP
jgi:hypothetical protein